MDDLNHRVAHDAFLQRLNEAGCLKGASERKALEKALEVIDKHYASKFESAEAAAIACTEKTGEVKQELSEVKAMARDAVECTHAASAAVEKSIAASELFTKEMRGAYDVFVTGINKEFRGMWLKSGLASAGGAAGATIAVIGLAFALAKYIK